jgi:hypothetical protein
MASARVRDRHADRGPRSPQRPRSLPERSGSSCNTAGGGGCSKDFFAMATKKLPWCRCTRRATAFWLSALALVSRTSCTAATKCGTL